jgi:YidC/Oxa1 family membrane protein insertase
MDRRLILALTLGVGVILLSNVLFPPAPPTPSPAKPAAAGARATQATAASAAPTSGAASDAASGATAVAGTTGSVVPALGAPPNVAATVPPVSAETITVSTPKATFRFSSIGATLIGAELRDYASLRRVKSASADGQRVEIAREGQSLVGYALVVPGDTIALAGVPFAVSQNDAAKGRTVTFTGTATGRSGATANVTLAYTVGVDSTSAYRMQVQATVSGLAGTPYLLLDMPRGLALSEADSAESLTHSAYSWLKRGGDANSLALTKLDPQTEEDSAERRIEPGPHTWIVSKSKYFMVGVLGADAQQSPFVEVNFFGGIQTPAGRPYNSATVVTELRGGNAAWELYVGPLEWRRLVAMGREFENANPYGGFLQGVIQPFATITMRVLLWMKATTQLNYGWVLVIFGVAIRLILWPLNQTAMRSQLKMQRISPELQAVQAKFKSDPQKLQAEMMKVYAAHGLSPFSTFSSCLPMLLPMPVLFALFFVFQNTIEFRGVSFLWLPDISMKDPYYIIPLAMGATMFLMSWIGMRNAPPNPQAKMMGWMMPVMFTVLFLNFASGLNLYYTVQNLAALPQQWLIAMERGKEQVRRT